MPKSYREIKEDLRNQSVYSVKKGEDTLSKGKGLGQLFLGMLQNPEMPIQFREKLETYGKAFQVLGQVTKEGEPDAEEEKRVNQAIKDLDGLQDFLMQEYHGETIHQLISRLHRSEFYQRNRNKLDVDFEYDDLYGGLDWDIENLHKYIGKDFSAEAVRTKDLGVIQENKNRRDARRNAAKAQMKDEKIPVSGLRLAMYLYKQNLDNKETKISEFYDKCTKKLSEVKEKADPQLKLEYEGLTELENTAGNLHISAVSTAYAVNKGNKQMSAAEAIKLQEEGEEFLNALREFKEKSPEKYKELGCEEYEKLLRETDFSPAQEVMDSVGLQDNAEKMTAYDWIERFKEEAVSGKAGKSENYPDDHFAKIMAARLLSDAERSTPSTLQKEMSYYDIHKMAMALQENSAFTDFMRKVKKDPALMQELITATSTFRGHGGELDDHFKDFLLHLPAGEMPNDPLLGRYMPTVIARIEVLQDQAKAKMKNGEKVYTEAAEILALRNLNKAQRKKKETLKVHVNTSQEGSGDVSVRTRNLAQSEEFRKLLDLNPKAVAKITDGHGGQMIEDLRGVLNDGTFEKEAGPEKKAALYNRDYLRSQMNGNTYGVRMKQLQENAAELKEMILDPRKQDQVPELLASAKKLSAEYLSLNYQVNEVEHSLLDGIHWSSVNKQAAALEKNETLSENFANAERAVDQLQKLIDLTGLDYTAEAMKLPAPEKAVQGQPAVAQQPGLGEGSKEEEGPKVQ